MQIFVDADACPVVDIVEDIAEKHNIPAHCCAIPIMCCIPITVK